MAAPLVVSFWFRAAFAWVDAVYAKTLPESDAALAAIGLTLPFEFMMIACWVGASNGLTARLAAAMGAREGARIEQLKRATKTLIRALATLFVGIALGIWLLAEHVVREPLVADRFRVYGTVLMAGSAITSFWSILPDSIVKAHHDTKSTMWAGLLSASLNVVLNTIFVFVFHWGIFGIAFSTVLGRLAGLVYALSRAAHHERTRAERGLDTRPGVFAHPLRAILAIAAPAAVTYLLMAVESLAVNGILERSADSVASLAAWSIFDRSLRFMAMPMIATGVALLPLCARLWGRGDLAGVRREVRVSLVATLVYVAFVLTPLALALGPWVARSLSESETTQRYAEIGMRYLPLAVLGLAPMLLLRAAFEGMQRPRPGLIAGLVRSLGLVVPLVLFGMLAAPHLGRPPIEGVYAGLTLGAGLASLFLHAWFRRALA